MRLLVEFAQISERSAREVLCTEFSIDGVRKFQQMILEPRIQACRALNRIPAPLRPLLLELEILVKVSSLQLLLLLCRLDTTLFRSGGYFVTRRVLETAASLAEERGRVLVIPPEVLAVLKAWAATDQEKLVKARKDPSGYHTSRAKQFHQDVGDIHAAILSAGLQPRPALVKGMLDACPKKRRIDVEAVLRKSGWQV